MTGIELRTLRRAIIPGAALSVLALLVPSAVRAQEGGRAPADSANRQQASHTVRPGDTLWSIARTYLGDPFQWPEIYRANPDVVEDPHWIYPGEVLKIPARTAATTVAAQSMSANPTLQNAPEAAAAAAPEQVSQPGNESPTVFASVSRRRATGIRIGGTMMAQPAVRQGEYTAAPFFSRSGGPAGAGRIIASAELQEISTISTLSERRLQFEERVTLVAPSGRTPEPGDLYLAYRLGGSVEGRQLLVPTAIIRVDETATGRTPIGHIMRTFESVMPGQSLVPYEPLPSDSIRPVSVSGGRTTTVIGVQGDPVVPGMQNYVFFPLSARDGVRAGDQLTIFRPARNEGGAMQPETSLATVTLVRVTDQGSTGIVIEQSSSRFEAGSPARITARLP
jgi:LysM repeat protein